MKTDSPFFSSFHYTYHVPAISFLKQMSKQTNGDAIVYHPYSQSLIELPFEEALVLRLFEDRFSIDKIAELIGKSKNTVTSILDELDDILRANVPLETIYHKKPTTFWLITDLRCNLKCKYCYTNAGSFDYHSSYKITNINVLQQALDIILEAFPSITRVNIFGGGEPLLSFDVIKQFIKYAKSQRSNLRFGMVTNATLINKKIVDFCQENKVKITISVDGPKLVNDVNRVFPNERGTYDFVVKAINVLRKCNEWFTVEATYTPYVFYYGYGLVEVIEHLKKFTPFIIIKTADYVPSTGGGIKLYNSMAGYLHLKYVNRVFKELKKDDPAFFDINVAYALSYIARKATKMVPCPFTAFVTIFPDGKLRLCHMLLDYELGDIKSKISELQEKYDIALRINEELANKFDYRDIWMSAIQDICPGILFGGLTKIANTNLHEKLMLSAYEKDLLTCYWDAFLVNIYKSLKEGVLESIYKNVEQLFKHFNRDE